MDDKHPTSQSEYLMYGISQILASISAPIVNTVVPFDPSQVAGLIAWWNSSNVILDGTNSFCTAWAPFKGSSVGDNTYTVSNSDGTFASVPLWLPDGAGVWGNTVIGCTFGTDESRFLAGANLVSGGGIAMPCTWYTTFMIHSNTNNTYLRLNSDGSAAGAHSYIPVGASTSLLAEDTGAGATTTYALDTPYVGCNIYSSTTNAAEAFLNNSLTAQAVGTNNGDLFTQLFFGSFSAEPTQWYLADMLVYSGSHNSTQRGEIMAYLSSNSSIPGYSP